MENRLIVLELFYVDLIHSSDGQHVLVFEPTEVDYLKKIVLAYMTGTDPIVCSIHFLR